MPLTIQAAMTSKSGKVTAEARFSVAAASPVK
jgi:hypothetical protein